MVLGITPNTKFVYSLSTSEEVLFYYIKLKRILAGGGGTRGNKNQG